MENEGSVFPEVVHKIMELRGQIWVGSFYFNQLNNYNDNGLRGKKSDGAAMLWTEVQMRTELLHKTFSRWGGKGKTRD